jgi:hypothetical protein
MGRTSPFKNGASPNPVTRSGLLATFKTALPHGFAVGQGVVVDQVLVAGSVMNPYNGSFVLKAVTADTFSYEMKSDPGADPDPSPPAPLPQFAGLWQVGYLGIENNVLEIAVSPNAASPSQAIALFEVFGREDPYVFRRGLVRDNVVRQLDDALDSQTLGVNVSSFENLLVEGNIISLAHPAPLQHLDSPNVEYFANQSAGGKAVFGFNRDTNRYADELTTSIQDTTLIALL